LTLLLFVILILNAGCTRAEPEKDPPASGSLVQMVSLPEELAENSGLIWYDNLLWTINDSGSGPWLFAVDASTGKINRRIQIVTAENNDWEEIAQDNTHIYIGDFGNNDGSRRDLGIYRIPKDRLEDTAVTPEVIDFRYADQTDYTPDPYNTRYDCEAMICYVDSIYLFTKNWISLHSHTYGLPALPGSYSVPHQGQMNGEGLVTGSAYDAKNQRLFLLGYLDYIPFLNIFDGYIPGREYKGIPETYLFADDFGRQTEGIALLENGDIVVSCEKGYTAPALFRVVLKE
jgi:hypothetical protein